MAERITDPTALQVGDRFRLYGVTYEVMTAWYRLVYGFTDLTCRAIYQTPPWNRTFANTICGPLTNAVWVRRAGQDVAEEQPDE